MDGNMRIDVAINKTDCGGFAFKVELFLRNLIGHGNTPCMAKAQVEDTDLGKWNGQATENRLTSFTMKLSILSVAGQPVPVAGVHST
ncbi:hypothetical protein JQX09_22555 [Sulfitobacter pseudonitzschiae]|uniref:Uncharacterized protein n=1 Tax=Pseudosulfitobacter pseudonitzschiae TaxID=1402135 RepID=A0A9Q2S2L5_9RHOB|nr:hypothetical protein [Pseudosulfitobacter pseudonitzschiae]MBM2294681.1 hypothetical protein [Pseudosulfitobacter pseudonitzschiae]MBM2299618.1 hypothetical protein [Pseudosulfitobacter pseudonitzschiae]MBM2304545.1 hypothetical protein [Pseudosulfitobacter pseudonitzschiae]MBM2314292.1 hypothetical protein [Pseudosulfitobacter pseudonitzschiae]MBM2319236.1 hypothetical protein [Pseudosulfitobacter pseudonitzschiae]